MYSDKLVNQFWLIKVKLPGGDRRPLTSHEANSTLNDSTPNNFALKTV